LWASGDAFFQIFVEDAKFVLGPNVGLVRGEEAEIKRDGFVGGRRRSGGSGG